MKFKLNENVCKCLILIVLSVILGIVIYRHRNPSNKVEKFNNKWVLPHPPGENSWWVFIIPVEGQPGVFIKFAAQVGREGGEAYLLLLRAQVTGTSGGSPKSPEYLCDYTNVQGGASHKSLFINGAITSISPTDNNYIKIINSTGDMGRAEKHILIDFSNKLVMDVLQQAAEAWTTLGPTRGIAPGAVDKKMKGIFQMLMPNIWALDARKDVRIDAVNFVWSVGIAGLQTCNADPHAGTCGVVPYVNYYTAMTGATILSYLHKNGLDHQPDGPKWKQYDDATFGWPGSAQLYTCAYRTDSDLGPRITIERVMSGRGDIPRLPSQEQPIALEWFHCITDPEDPYTLHFILAFYPLSKADSETQFGWTPHNGGYIYHKHGWKEEPGKEGNNPYPPADGLVITHFPNTVTEWQEFKNMSNLPSGLFPKSATCINTFQPGRIKKPENLSKECGALDICVIPGDKDDIDITVISSNVPQT